MVGALAFPATGEAYYRDWMVDPLFAMTAQVADGTSGYDSASADGVGCRQLHGQRLVRCRYRVEWNGGDGQCETVTYVRPNRWRNGRGGTCPREWFLPSGWRRVEFR